MATIMKIFQNFYITAEFTRFAQYVYGKEILSEGNFGVILKNTMVIIAHL